MKKMLTNELRFIIRNGHRILQQKVYYIDPNRDPVRSTGDHEWIDIPLEEEI